MLYVDASTAMFRPIHSYPSSTGCKSAYSLAVPTPSHKVRVWLCFVYTKLYRITKIWYNQSERSTFNQQIFLLATSEK